MKLPGTMTLLLLAGLAASPARLPAQPDHIFTYKKTPTETPTPGTASIDRAQSDCLESATSLSATCACLSAPLAAWQQEQDRAMAALQSALSGTAGAVQLLQSQSDWLRYRDSAFACFDSVVAVSPGAASKICNAKATLMAARAKELNALLIQAKVGP